MKCGTVSRELWFIVFGEISRDQASRREKCVFLSRLVLKRKLGTKSLVPKYQRNDSSSLKPCVAVSNQREVE